MSKLSRWLLRALAATLLFEPWLCAQAAEPENRLAGIVPNDSALFIHVQDLDRLEAEWQQTGYSAIYKSPAMQPFWQEIRQKRGGLMPNEVLGCPWADLKRAASKGAAYVMWPTKTSELGGALLADCSGNADGASAALSATVNEWRARKAKTNDLTLGGVTIVEGQFPTQANRPSEKRFAFVQQDFLAVCDRLEIAQELTSRIAGAKKPSLATLPAYVQTMVDDENNKVLQAGAIRWFIEPWRLWKASLDPKAPPENASRRDLEFYERQGFAGISAMGGIIRLDDDRHETAHRTRVVAKTPLTKSAGILCFVERSDFALDWLVPPSAASVTVFHWDIPAAVAAYGFAYDEIYAEDYRGAFQELIDSIENEADGPEAKVRQDIVQRLASKVLSISDYSGKKTKANPTGARTLLACRTNDGEKTATAVKRFFQGEKAIEVVVDNGVDVWQGKKSQSDLLRGDAEDPWSLAIDALCIAKGHLLIATDRTLLHEMLQQLEKDSAAPPPDPFFAADSPGRKICARLIRKLEPTLEANFVLMRKGQVGQAGGWAGLVLDLLFFSVPGEAPDDRIDSSKLPDYDTVLGHLGTEHTTVEPLDDGWMLRGTQSKPVQ